MRSQDLERFNGFRQQRLRRIEEHVKLVSICDAFDTMTSQRPYHAPMSKERALDILQAYLGTQFDIELSFTFKHLGRGGKFDHIILHSDKRIPLQHCPMCGPTIEVTRHQNKGDLTRCRVCGTQYTVNDAAVSLDSKEKNKHMVDHFIDVTIGDQTRRVAYCLALCSN